MFLRLWPSEKLLYIPFEARHFQAVSARFPKTSTTFNEKTDRMALSSKSLAGPGYIILNGLRVMNIISFLAVITASIVMLVKTSVTTHLFFFDALCHVITAISSMFFIASELCVFPLYFERYWPLLSPRHGLVTLAIAMIVIGITVMGNLNKDAGSVEHLGLAFWQIVISSGILIFILGHLNLLATFIFRDRKQDINARMVRSNGAAEYKTPIQESSSYKGTPPAPVLAQTYISQPMTPPGGKGSSFRIFGGDRSPEPTLPSYHNRSDSPDRLEPGNISPTSKYSRNTACTRKTMWGNFLGANSRRSRMSLAPPLPINSSFSGGMRQANHSPEISGPLNTNPQFSHLARPDSAMHPSRSGESDPYRWKV
ncbi:uncharacterized protein K489DRAFT_54082 [Dissoconium aciculare CBS 342.82]|uniref:DUF7598 domain-containing protein n=1 Tax=Dissoconium aciculare CBS 342.82 TaxID=1314786 RepID=A0A6J3M0C6_9PEZI|nr:uncharacterized protein K489DRAFT_54082 [Dissoconium aciculare CBS 342.82]KAF1820342.1 hypothetical protein K489DRAFT_54082 [Dissoconium aciculare CBS 342.82]